MDQGGRLLIAWIALAAFAPSLGAVTVSGRITQCCGGGPAGQKFVVASERRLSTVMIRGHCATIINEFISTEVGSTTTAADGTYTIEYTPPPQECPSETQVLIEVYNNSSRGFPFGSSTPVPREDTVLLEDFDIGFVPSCPPPRISFSFEAPSSVVGLAGQKARFDAFIILTTECLLSSGAPQGPDGWNVNIAAEGGTVVDASTSETVSALTTDQPPGLRFSCVSFPTLIKKVGKTGSSSTEECKDLNIATSGVALIRSCDFPRPLRLSAGSHRILRVTTEVTMPSNILPGSCRLFFPDGCQIIANPIDNTGFYDNPDGTATKVPAERSDLTVMLIPQLPILLFRRADANQSGAVDLSDAVATFGYLFLGAKTPGCLDAADSNGDGSLDLSDGVTTLTFLFLGGATIPSPGPVECGTGRASGPGCESFPGCN